MDSAYIILTISICCALLGATHALTSEEEALMYGVTLTRNGDTYTLKSTGIPDHETDDFPTDYNPNSIQSQSFSYSINVNPELLSESMDVTGCLPMGVIGFSVNGVPLYNPYTATGYNAVDGENRELFDPCDGHPDMLGRYHYHQRPTCLTNSLFDADQSEVMIGIAIDGHPIYTTADGVQTGLDACNGKMVDGSYRYYSTNAFPYILGCFVGTVVENSVINMEDMDPLGGEMPPSGADMPPPNGDMPPPNGDMPPPNGDMPPGGDTPPPGTPMCFFSTEEFPDGFDDLTSGVVNAASGTEDGNGNGAATGTVEGMVTVAVLGMNYFIKRFLQ